MSLEIDVRDLLTQATSIAQRHGITVEQLFDRMRLHEWKYSPPSPSPAQALASRASEIAKLVTHAGGSVADLNDLVKNMATSRPMSMPGNALLEKLLERADVRHANRARDAEVARARFGIDSMDAFAETAALFMRQPKIKRESKTMSESEKDNAEDAINAAREAGLDDE